MNIRISIDITPEEYDIVKRVLLLEPWELERRMLVNVGEREMVEKLNIPVRIANALRRSGWKYIDEVILTYRDDKESFLRVKNIGYESLKIIGEALENYQKLVKKIN